MVQQLKKNWFMVGLLATTIITVADPTGSIAAPGLWLKEHRGPDLIIILIFLFSGMALNTSQVRDGVKDVQGTLLALAIIFVVAPLIALPFSLLALPPGFLLGIYLVAVMPTTLSSGVVMTQAAGGNMAHALLITILANTSAVVTIPATLAVLLASGGEGRTIQIEQLPIMVKIATLVLLPLLFGIILRNRLPRLLAPLLPLTATLNQTGILLVVWMATCKGQEAILASLASILPVIGATFCFHLALLLVGITATALFKIGKSRRESVILMGGQKTLPLSLILQVSLFPEYGLALVVCVLHHIMQQGRADRSGIELERC